MDTKSYSPDEIVYEGRSVSVLLNSKKNTYWPILMNLSKSQVTLSFNFYLCLRYTINPEICFQW